MEFVTITAAEYNVLANPDPGVLYIAGDGLPPVARNPETAREWREVDAAICEALQQAHATDVLRLGRHG